MVSLSWHILFTLASLSLHFHIDITTYHLTAYLLAFRQHTFSFDSIATHQITQERQQEEARASSKMASRKAMEILEGMMKNVSICGEQAGGQAGGGGGDGIERQAQQLCREIEKLVGALAVKDPIIKQLSGKIAGLEKDLPALERANRHVVAENTQLKEDVCELESWREQCESEHAANNRLWHENAHLVARNAELEQANATLNSENEAYLQAIAQGQPAASQQGQDAMEE